MTWRHVDPRTWRQTQFVIFAIAIAWGTDYMFVPSTSSTLLSSLERSMPLEVWGGLLIAAGVAGLVAELALGDDPIFPTARRRRWAWVTNSAHTVLCGIYFGLASNALIDVFEKQNDGGTFGWRSAAMWYGFAWLNAQFVRRLEVQP